MLHLIPLVIINLKKKKTNMWIKVIFIKLKFNPSSIDYGWINAYVPST